VTTPGAGGPPFVEGADWRAISGAAYFHATNRGKRSIELDFESEGRAAYRQEARRALRRADREFQGRAARQIRPRLCGLREECPRLIYCSVTGFGQTGPYAAPRRL
jgi:crotonobetainyl-CoA:carnitine CoA-transferase CaiB-like acyl-CoA transferase